MSQIQTAGCNEMFIIVMAFLSKLRSFVWSYTRSTKVNVKLSQCFFFNWAPRLEGVLEE